MNLAFDKGAYQFNYDGVWSKSVYDFELNTNIDHAELERFDRIVSEQERSQWC